MRKAVCLSALFVFGLFAFLNSEAGMISPTQQAVIDGPGPTLSPQLAHDIGPDPTFLSGNHQTIFIGPGPDFSSKTFTAIIIGPGPTASPTAIDVGTEPHGVTVV